MGKLKQIIVLILVTSTGIYGEAKLTKYERELLAEINLARTKPAEYARLINASRNNRRLYYYEGIQVLDEAVTYLKKQRPLPPLKFAKGLNKAADDHGFWHGIQGYTGHDGLGGRDVSERVQHYGKGYAGENIDYGYHTARHSIFRLIIDDNVPSRGHRDNIFDSSYKSVGIACRPHKKYGQSCVFNFASNYKTYKNKGSRLEKTIKWINARVDYAGRMGQDELQRTGTTIEQTFTVQAAGFSFGDLRTNYHPWLANDQSVYGSGGAVQVALWPNVSVNDSLFLEPASGSLADEALGANRNGKGLAARVPKKRFVGIEAGYLQRIESERVYGLYRNQVAPIGKPVQPDSLFMIALAGNPGFNTGNILFGLVPGTAATEYGTQAVSPALFAQIVFVRGSYYKEESAFGKAGLDIEYYEIALDPSLRGTPSPFFLSYRHERKARKNEDRLVRSIKAGLTFGWSYMDLITSVLYQDIRYSWPGVDGRRHGSGAAVVLQSDHLLPYCQVYISADFLGIGLEHDPFNWGEQWHIFRAGISSNLSRAIYPYNPR